MSFVDCSEKWTALRVNSADRASGTSSDFYAYSASHDWHGDYALYSAILPNTLYSITSANSTIYFTENSVAKTAALPIGYYSDASLASAVATAMTTASGGYNTYTCALSSLTEGLTISAGNPFQLTFATNMSSSARIPMGFSATDTALATSQVSDQVMNLAQTLTFNILISGVAGTSTTKGNGASFVVPIDQNSLGVVTYKGHHPLQRVHFEQPVKNLHVQLVGDNQQALDLRGAEWTMTVLKLSEYSKRYN